MCLLLFPWSAQAMDGPTLARKVHDRDDGKDSYAKVQMTLVDKRGGNEERSLVTAAKDYGDMVKSYMRFTSPPSIDGTAFLTWENDDRDDDQFLYLPELRRVRRIVSSQKDNRFVNTDYTYEDMKRRKVEEDNHQVLGSEQYNGHDCWILESVPKDGDDSQYGKRVSWVEKNSFVILKAHMYDKKGGIKKELNTGELKQIDGIWTIMESELHDRERDHRTLIKVEDVRYNTGVPDRVFTEQYMLHAE
jgi:outer membrane lipoprotein-sorting protein